MPPFLQFVIRRALVVPFALLIITMLLYGGVMLTPPETRATLYMSKGRGRQSENVIPVIIREHHLAEPYFVQYGYWLGSLAQGDWGYSPSLAEDVLPAMLRRTPATAELAFYSLLLFIPLGLASGVISGWRQNGRFDNTFRIVAFAVTSLPPFILALVLISIFYVTLGWFAPERISTMLSYQLPTQGFEFYTGFYTLDALLNRRPDVALDALRHLAMPVFTLSLVHWATLGRITRAVMLAERSKDYILAARAHGVGEAKVMWKHAFRNALAPSITSLALSAASLLTGIFLVEIIFNFAGISGVIVRSMSGVPDAPAALGFSIYSVIIVLLVMFLLDVIQAALDPRIRDEALRA
jgi:peptide/nickel transport system permease protein